jgi:REP element-mobilizing transposase RayT
VGAVVGAFKSLTTGAYIRGVKDHGWPEFWGRVWQRNYYEHIIRSDHALDRIRSYIVNNPSRWHEDEENPDRLGR